MNRRLLLWADRAEVIYLCAVWAGIIVLLMGNVLLMR